MDGVHYTGYEATQMQRALERAIRAQKRRVMVDEAAGDQEKLGQDKSKLAVLHQRYKEFSKAAELRTQYERTEVAGFGEKRGKNLANSSERGILKDTNRKGIPITDEAIQRVPQVRPEGWSQEQAERLQEAHRELLRSVMDKPVGTEAGAVYTLDMRLIERRIGNNADQTIALPRCADPYISIHNHPSGEIFSPTDLESFFYNGDMDGMTVVGNNGSVYAAIKTPKYDGFLAYQQYIKLRGNLTKYLKARDIEGYIRTITDFLDGGHVYGLEFIKG